MVAPAWPSLTGNGLAMRLGLFLEALAQVGRVDLIVVPIAGQSRHDDLVARLGIHARVIEIQGRTDTEFGLLMRIPDDEARLRAFRSYGRPTLAASVTQAVIDEIRTVVRAGGHDLVQIGRSYLADIGSGCRDLVPRLSIDLDDDDVVAFRRLSRSALRQGRPLAARWLEAEAEAFRALQATAADVADAVQIASEVARRSVGLRIEGRPPDIVANAVPIPPRIHRRDDGTTLLFVGSLGYEPNAEGLRWMLEAVWPRLGKRRAGLRLRIAGGGDADWLRRHPRVEKLGPVADLTPVYATATLALAPIRSGSGTRIKLIEAAAFGVPFVTTTLGTEGLAFEDRHGFFGDSPADFASACEDALGDRRDRALRAAAARRLACRSHDRRSALGRLSAAFRRLLDRQPVADEPQSTGFLGHIHG